MRSRLATATLTAAVVVLSLPTLLSQQMRQRDPAPFERPKPMTAIASPSNAETLALLQRVVTDAGFTVVSADREKGELSAIRRDAPTSQAADRVLIWLERDAGKPSERANVYLMYARFEPLLGSKDPVRVRMYDNELARMVALQDAVIAFATSVK